MRTARYDAALCGAAAGYGSERHGKCEALQQAIDALAEEPTGDPEFHWNKPAKGRGASAPDRPGMRLTLIGQAGIRHGRH